MPENIHDSFEAELDITHKDFAREVYYACENDG